MRFDSLNDWLIWQDQLHPASIDLGLERCGQVADQMGLRSCQFKIVSVAGTNGKGSCIAFMESILRCANVRVGSYTSPHLLRYNERIRISGRPVGDEELMSAFAAVDEGRGSTSLTFFEFGTLAAMTLFQRSELDVVLLEVGLGGRLDTVNLFDAQVSVLTSIDLDHTDWLGPDRESIGFEKAGILRRGCPAVCGDPNLPASVVNHAAKLDAPLYQLNKDFSLDADGVFVCWNYGERAITDIPRPGLKGAHQLDNAAVAITALQFLSVFDDPDPIRRGVPAAFLPGRFQTVAQKPQVIVDVAHNPQAALFLAETLRNEECGGATHAFLGMLMDKDVDTMLDHMAPVIDHWHVAGVGSPRGADRAYMEARINSSNLVGTVSFYDRVEDAYPKVRPQLGVMDRLIAFGCFFTAAEVLRVETSI